MLGTIRGRVAALCVGVVFGVAGTGSAVGKDRQRSAAARAEFQRLHPCPAPLPGSSGHRGPCPGYVVDHVQALACGGPDTPANMQWQTEAEAKAKDRWELACK